MYLAISVLCVCVCVIVLLLCAIVAFEQTYIVDLS